MNSNFPKLKLKQYARVQDRETGEARYWKSFSVTREDQLQSSPNCISFNLTDNSSYLVTGSVKVNLYDSQTDKVVRSYSRFSDDAYSGKFRKDGKLLVAGDKTSAVKVFDVQTKSLLREMKKHSAAVRCCSWSADGLRVYSGSDDRQAFCWDLATEQVLFSTGSGRDSSHKDYIRALDASSVSPDLFATGSYDHSVKVWDCRQGSSSSPVISSIALNHPVQSCMFTPSGTMLLVASGSEVRVFDLLAGGRLLHCFDNHQKHVTSLCMDGTSSRILSAGLDGHIKIYSLQTLQVVHGMKFTTPVVAVAVSGDNSKLVAGFVDGTVMARNRRRDAAETISAAATHPQEDGSRRDRSRHFKGAGLHSSEPEVRTERFVRLAPYEKLLKKFSYQAALDSAMKSRNPVIVVTVIEELCRRSGLSIALSGRDEASVEPILSFCARFVNHPKYCRVVVQVVHKLLDIYAGSLGGHSDGAVMDDLFCKLHRQVAAELQFQRQVIRVMGSLDGIISAAAVPKIINCAESTLDITTLEEGDEGIETTTATTAASTSSTLNS